MPNLHLKYDCKLRCFGLKLWKISIQNNLIIRNVISNRMPQSRIALNLWFSNIIKNHVPSTFCSAVLDALSLGQLPSWVGDGYHSSRHRFQARWCPAEGGGYCFLRLFQSLEIFLRRLPVDLHLNLIVENLVMGPLLNQSLTMEMWTYKQFSY